MQTSAACSLKYPFQQITVDRFAIPTPRGELFEPTGKDVCAVIRNAALARQNQLDSLLNPSAFVADKGVEEFHHRQDVRLPGLLVVL